VLNLIINILFGYGVETLYFGYAYNKIKQLDYKSTYIVYLISYVIGAIIIQFTFNNIYIGYIITSFLFEIINNCVHKQKFNITNVFLILNLLLISSILTTIPILIFGYNMVSFIINRLEIITLLILIKFTPIEKLYNLIVNNWNRKANNKIKSVTIRNFTLITIYTLITIINVFVCNVLLNIYQSIL